MLPAIGSFAIAETITSTVVGNRLVQVRASDGKIVDQTVGDFFAEIHVPSMEIFTSQFFSLNAESGFGEVIEMRAYPGILGYTVDCFSDSDRIRLRRGNLSDDTTALVDLTDSSLLTRYVDASGDTTGEIALDADGVAIEGDEVTLEANDDTYFGRNAAGLWEAGSPSDANDRVIDGHNGTDAIRQQKSGKQRFISEANNQGFSFDTGTGGGNVRLSYASDTWSVGPSTNFLFDGGGLVICKNTWYLQNAANFYFDTGTGATSGVQAAAAGVIRVSNASSGGGTFAYTPYTPAQITANQANYAHIHSRSLLVRLSTDASRDLQGITAGVDGEMHILANVGVQNLVLKDASGSATGAPIWTTTGADITLAPGEQAFIWYDDTLDVWWASPRQ